MGCITTAIRLLSGMRETVSHAMFDSGSYPTIGAGRSPIRIPSGSPASKHDADAAAYLGDHRRLPEEKRDNNYLKREYAELVKRGPVRYVLQIQLHEVSAADSAEVRNPLRPWDEATHPYMDLAHVEINKAL